MIRGYLSWYVQGTSKGFRPCIYNSGADRDSYSKDTVIKVLWLLFWVIQQAWLVGFSALMGYAMFPKCAFISHLQFRWLPDPVVRVCAM